MKSRHIILSTILAFVFCIPKIQAQNITFQPVYFPIDSAKITKATRESLERVAQLMKANPGVTLSLEAYAGSKEGSSDAKTLESAQSGGRSKSIGQ